MRRQRIWIHILLWTSLYLFWILIFQKRAFVFSRTMTVQFCYLFFIAANYYFNIFFTVQKFLFQKNYIGFGSLFLAGIFTGSLLRVPLAMFLNQHYFIPGKQQPGFYQLFLNSFINIFIWVICIVAGKLIIDRIRFQKYVDDIKKEKSKTELDFLKAQFNPHFLFNSINSIYGHIDKNNFTARKMLLTFSEMLRYQLYDCNTEFISIDKELNYIRNYIALQQSRKEDNLIVHFDVDENVKGFTITPLLFIAFIENSFKYVSNNEDRENRVEISLQKKGDTLVFRTYNTRENNNDNGMEHNGIGIVNVKRRLELLYANRHDLNIKEQDQSHEVVLKLQLT